MKRKISTIFSKRPGGGRDLARRAASAVIALTLTVTGAAGTAAAALEPAAAAQPVPAYTAYQEENGFAGFEAMTEATAAEDPLAARYEVTAIAPDADGRITLTPDEFTAPTAGSP